MDKEEVIKFKKEDILFVLYFYLQGIIGEPAFNKRDEGLMSITEAETRMCQWRIPKQLKPSIIKIWQKLGIVKKVGNRNIQFKKTTFDINDLRMVNEELKIYPEEELGLVFKKKKKNANRNI